VKVPIGGIMPLRYTAHECFAHDSVKCRSRRL